MNGALVGEGGLGEEAREPGRSKNTWKMHASPRGVRRGARNDSTGTPDWNRGVITVAVVVCDEAARLDECLASVAPPDVFHPDV